MALTKAQLKEASDHVKWMVKKLEKGELDKYDMAGIHKNVINSIYIGTSELTNPSFGISAKFESIKNEILRVEYQIALSRKFAATEKFGVSKQEIDKAVKFFHLAIKNTKERFTLNNIIAEKYK